MVVIKKDKEKTLEYIRAKDYTNYDPRWMKGHSVRYMNFELKGPSGNINRKRKHIIKYYQIEYLEEKKIIEEEKKI